MQVSWGLQKVVRWEKGAKGKHSFGMEGSHQPKDIEDLKMPDARFLPYPDSPTGPEVEAQLRKLGLGYRARFVSASARAILEEYGGLPWLQQLRRAPYEEAHRALCTLPGVGTKVRPQWGRSYPYHPRRE